MRFAEHSVASRWVAAALAIVGALAGAGLFPTSSGAAVPVAGPQVDVGYVSLVPARLFDTRSAMFTIDGQQLGGGPIAANTTKSVSPLGRGGVPTTGVAAVAVNVTVTNTVGPGYLTVWSGATAQPNTSTLNFIGGTTIANFAIVQVGTNGQFNIRPSQTTDVVVDVLGWVPTLSPITTISPARVRDTRPGFATIDGLESGGGAIPANTIIDVAVTGRGPIPATASAAIVNITVTGPTGPGYLTAWPAGSTPPNASTLNFAAGQTIANGAIVKLGIGNKISIRPVNASTRIVVDVVGLVSASSNIVPLAPARLLDTRTPMTTIDGISQGGGLVAAGNSIDLPIAGRGGVPSSGVSAVIANITVTEPTAEGYVSGWPTGSAPPIASTLNFVKNQTIANGTILKLGPTGQITLSPSNASSHLVVDVTGWISDGTPSSGVAPVVLYTDITSGPTSGGENNRGIYLSVFGKNFGSSGLGSTVKVFINNVEVDNYRSLGPARGRPDIQQITVQVGALGSPPIRTPLPIKVVVGTAISNTDQTFTVNPGNIYFVDNVNGFDTSDTTTGGTFAAPFKTVQRSGGVSGSFQITSAAQGGAWGRVRAGDFIVLRGGTYREIGFPNSAGTEGYFLQALNKSGCSIGTNCAQGGGTSSGPIAILGFPGETAFIDRTNTRGNANFGGGISGADSVRQGSGYGAWITVANVKIESGFTDGPINVQKGEDNPLGANWRVVNNELTAASCATSTLCRAGAIAGGGVGNYWVGNYGHDIFDQPDASTSLENHGIYIGGGGTFEIAYNVFDRIPGGNGIQVQSFYTTVTSLRIHHNVIRNVGKHGLNFAAGIVGGVVVWNNVIADTDYAGVRFADDATRNLKIYNNTFYNTGRLGNPASGAALTNDTNAAAGMFEIRNNIFWAGAASGYNSGCCNGGFGGGSTVATNNLWFGAGAPPSFDTASRTGNPVFVSAGFDFHVTSASPAIDNGSSAVAAVVVDDFDIATTAQQRTLRPAGAAFDIGAYER